MMRVTQFRDVLSCESDSEFAVFRTAGSTVVTADPPAYSATAGDETGILEKQLLEPLEPPYTGPYEIEKRTKIFTLDIDGKQHTFFIDCLKPAHLFSEVVNKDTPFLPPSDVVTQFSRRSHPVVRFQSSPSSGLQGEYCGDC
ncbi:hypothetical protein NPIL_198231 [Nephila pilipes]|uniref:Uncharacterized protein n=1 Tax=Nephila pilipes TaxID=299642 RepID=A0A8X6PMM5_NEPPI|nr:hypothetical protein NPIL_198231 [Nephila pilipes]